MPVEFPFAAALLDWYADHQRDLPWRRDVADPYRVWLSEIMLQQTTVAAVTPYYTAFTARWPNVDALAAARDEDVMAAWAGLGYYARARNLLACARAVVRDHGSRFPGSEAALRTLPGIGDYTAAAVAAFAFGQRAVIVDGNVERVVSRLFAIAEPLPAARRIIRAHMDEITPATQAGDFAQAIMDLARSVCTPRTPACMACPLFTGCAAAQGDVPARFPVRPMKTDKPVRKATAWWIAHDGAVLLVRRPARGLLGGLLALPSDLTASDWTPLAGVEIAEVRHVFTHFALTLSICSATLAEGCNLPPDSRWWPLEQLDTAGLPSLFAKAVRAVREMKGQ